MKDIPLSFSEKLNYNSPLQIYTIQTRDKSYLSLNEYNDSVISYKTKMMYLWLVIGVIIIYINLKKKPKNVLVENKDYTPPYEHGKIRRRQASFLDIPAIKKLFRESITHINNQDYTPEQISAWIKRGENDDMCEKLLSLSRVAGFCIPPKSFTYLIPIFKFYTCVS